MEAGGGGGAFDSGDRRSWTECGAGCAGTIWAVGDFEGWGGLPASGCGLGGEPSICCFKSGKVPCGQQSESDVLATRLEERRDAGSKDLQNHCLSSSQSPDFCVI